MKRYDGKTQYSSKPHIGRYVVLFLCVALIVAGALFFLATIDKVKLRAQVRPGDTVRIEVKNLRVSSQMIKQSGKLYNGDTVAAEAEWMCLVGKA